MGSSRKRILYSLLLVLAWFGFLIEGTRALFTDTVTLAGNTVTTGSVELLISNSQNGSSTLYADSRPGFTYSLNPGTSKELYFFIKNASADEVTLDLSVTSVIAGGPNSPLARMIAVDFTPVDSSGVATGPTVSSTVYNLATSAQPLGVGVAKGIAQRFLVKTTLQSDVTQQNDTISYDYVFSGTQHTP